MPGNGLLTIREEIYLLSILELDKGAYGVAIRDSVSAKTGQPIAWGSLYFVLAGLAKKGLVTKSAGEPTRRRGGRRRFFYTLTGKGRAELESVLELHKTLWRDRDAIPSRPD